MATNLVVNFIGKNNLSKTTAVMTKDLKAFQTRVKSVGSSLDKAFAGVGLTLGVAALANGLKNATKAASDDRKGQGLLAQALQKTVGATSQAIAGAEAYVKKTQLQTSVLDDELRPALSTAVLATGSLATGQRILDAALDISARTGKDLGSVTGALSKAFNGNAGALQKLVPGLKLTGDVIADVEAGFGGAAEAAANLDPYKRLEVAFAEIQEQIGKALLPALEEFTAYIVSPDGQKNIKQIVNLFVAFGKGVVDVTKLLIDNANTVKAIVAALIVLRVGWSASTSLVALYTAVTGKAVAATKLLKYALITTGVGALVVLVASLASGWIEAGEAKDSYMEDPFAGSGDFTISDWAKKNKDTLIPDFSDEWLRLGYESYGAYLQGAYEASLVETEKKNKIKEETKKVAEEIKKALESKIADLKKTAEKFRDAFGLAFGTFGEDENSVFNVDVIINKLKRVVTAAKGFADNIKKLRKAGADESVISEIVGMGPAQGNIVAKGLLGSGKLAEYLTLRKSLYGTGAQVGSEAALSTQNTYEININKSVISASDIIREIKLYEKKTGSKFLVGN